MCCKGETVTNSYNGIPVESRGSIGYGAAKVRQGQDEMRFATLGCVANRIVAAYQAAAMTMGNRDDPILDCLQADDRLDITGLFAFHDWLARHWRTMIAKGSFYQCDGSTEGHVFQWMIWAEAEAARMQSQSPRLIRAVCTVIVRRAPRQALEAEIALWEMMHIYYPVSRHVAPVPVPARPGGGQSGQARPHLGLAD